MLGNRSLGHYCRRTSRYLTTTAWRSEGGGGAWERWVCLTVRDGLQSGQDYHRYEVAEGSDQEAIRWAHLTALRFRDMADLEDILKVRRLDRALSRN